MTEGTQEIFAPDLDLYDEVPEEITINEVVIEEQVLKNLCVIDEELICMLNTTIEHVYDTVGASVIYELDLDREEGLIELL